MMPIVQSFEFALAGGTSAVDVTISKPAGVQPGDLLILLVGCEDNTGSPSFADKAGWDKRFEFGDATPDTKIGCYTRIADGSEPASETVTWTATGTDAGGGWYLRVTNHDPAAYWHILGSADQTAGATSSTAPSVTTSVADCLVFALHAFDGGDGTRGVNGTGWPSDFPADQVLYDTTATTAWSGGWVAKELAAPGASGDVNFTSSNSDGMVQVQFAIAGIGAGIAGITPDDFTMVDAFDVSGQAFGASQGASTIYLSDANTLAGSGDEVDITAAVTGWSDTLIEVDLSTLDSTVEDALHTLGSGDRYFIALVGSDEYSVPLYLRRPEAFSMSAGALTEGPTTQRLTGLTGTFAAGRATETENPSSTLVNVPADGNREDVWSIQSLNTGRTETYEFRVLYNGQPLDTYTVTPEVTVTSGGTENVTATVTGVAATGGVGTATASGTENVTATVTGVAATGGVGTATASGTADVTATVTGVEATGTPGAATASGTENVTATVTGVEATGTPGAATASGGGGGGVPARVTLDGTYGIFRGDLGASASTLTLEVRASWTAIASDLQFMASNSTGFYWRGAGDFGVYTEDLGGGVFQTGGTYNAGDLVTVRYEIDPAGGLTGGNTLRILVDGTPVIETATAGTSVDTTLWFFQDSAGNNRFQGEVEYLTLWLNGVQTLDLRGTAAVWNGATGAVGTVTDVPGTGGGGDVAATVTGVEATGTPGTATASGTASVTASVTGVQAAGQIGTVTVSTGSNVTATPTGVQATASVGAATASGTENVTATVSGVSATGSVGSVVADVGGIAVAQYYYLNSLVSHETGAWTTSTQLPNWMDRLALAGGNTYAVDSEFGFVPQWTAPPRASMGYSEADPVGITGSSWTGASAVDRLSFVPDNFDGQAFDPDANTNILTSTTYEDGILALIDAWEANAANAGRVYSIYAGWPDMGPYGEPATITPTNLLAWQTYGLGAYQDWMELLVSRLQTARPALDIRLADISRVLLLTYQNTVVSGISAGDLFEDDAPHGRSSWYFLASLVEYMETYGEKPPAGYTPDAGFGVNSTITSNYQDIVDYMWDQLQGAVDVTATVTGAAAAGSVGAATAAGTASVTATVTGVQASGAIGSATASGAINGLAPVTGVQASGAVGSAAAVGDGAAAVTGVSATASIGAAQGIPTTFVAVTGVVATGAVGTATIEAISAPIYATGVECVGSIGSVLVWGLLGADAVSWTDQPPSGTDIWTEAPASGGSWAEVPS